MNLDELHYGLSALVLAALIPLSTLFIRGRTVWRDAVSDSAKRATEMAQLRFEVDQIKEWQREHSSKCTVEHSAITDALTVGLNKLEDKIDTMAAEAKADRAALHEKVNSLSIAQARLTGEVEGHHGT